MCPQRLLRLEVGICVGIGAKAEGAEPGKRCGVHPGVFVKSAQEIEIKGDGLTVSAKGRRDGPRGLANESRAGAGDVFAMLINNSRVKRDSKQLSEDTDSRAVGLTYDAPTVLNKNAANFR